MPYMSEIFFYNSSLLISSLMSIDLPLKSTDLLIHKSCNTKLKHNFSSSAFWFEIDEDKRG